MLLPHVLAALREAESVEQVVVVEGAHALDPLGEARHRLVHCPEWERGPGATLRCGLAVLDADVDAAVVVLADGPDLPAAAVERLVDAWRRTGAELVAASYDGVRGHPLLLAREAWGDVPDEGLRARTPRLVACDDLGPPGDVDRPGDLPERLR